MSSLLEQVELSARDRVEVAQARVEELRRRIDDYLVEKENIVTGFDVQEQVVRKRNRLLTYYHADPEEWADWRWQMRHRITTVDALNEVVMLTEDEGRAVERVGAQFRWAVSPYYATLMMDGLPSDPIRLQAVPSLEELADSGGCDDPMAEEFSSPAPAVTRRYPDRLIINVTNQCAMYCRHCQRRRNIGETDRHQSRRVLEQALDYVEANREIRDVLITGGDALLLGDETIDWILGKLDRISHVEIKRIGTRVIVTMPQRITPELCAILEKHPPLYINTQFNHPREITPVAARACDMLVKAGAVLGNQTVLLKGVNDDPHIMKKLNQELLKIRVRPYYLFQAKQVRGTGHFITSIHKGLEITEKLRGYTSGLAVPSYIVNAPGGLGKVPLSPQYILTCNDKQFTLRTWEKKVVPYANETNKLRGSHDGKPAELCLPPKIQ